MVPFKIGASAAAAAPPHREELGHSPLLLPLRCIKDNLGYPNFKGFYQLAYRHVPCTQ